MVTAVLPSSAKERDVTKACHKETGQPLDKICPICLCMLSPWTSYPKLLLSIDLICACPGVSSIILACRDTKKFSSTDPDH